jgi:hypothetical protein
MGIFGPGLFSDSLKMIFATIPNDVLLIIRSYIFIFRFEDVVETETDELEIFVRQEPERNWRHFLAVSNSQCWKGVRNELRIWSLNEKSFRKYLTDDCFREYINERMINPAVQLHCRSVEPLDTINSLVAELVAGSSIGCLSINGYSLSDFPSSRFLRTLSIGRLSSFALERLGDFPLLETLQLWECTDLTTIGKMDNLKHLLLKDSNERVISQFPLEQLEKLVISGSIAVDFTKFSHRLKCLKDLHISLLFYLPVDDRIFTAQQHPFLNSLMKLRLEYFHEIDLTGLINLRHLSIIATPNDQISGKDGIYPNLLSFSWKTNSTTGEKLDFYRTKLTNVSEFTFLSSFTVEKEPLPLHDGLKSLTLQLRGLKFINPSPGRHFYSVKLSSSHLPDYSMFSNVQILYLKDCSTLIDLQPFRNVPYLHLETLRYAKDFSCLGNQRYLKISRCEGLNDEAVSHFGNIYYLCIFNCNVSVIEGLTHNRFIILDSNDKLKEIYLPGDDYILVAARYCFNFARIHLTGRVYSLEVSELGRNMESLKLNCSYLNGKEVAQKKQEKPNSTCSLS